MNVRRLKLFASASALVVLVPAWLLWPTTSDDPSLNRIKAWRGYRLPPEHQRVVTSYHRLRSHGVVELHCERMAAHLCSADAAGVLGPAGAVTPNYALHAGGEKSNCFIWFDDRTNTLELSSGLTGDVPKSLQLTPTLARHVRAVIENRGKTLFSLDRL